MNNSDSDEEYVPKKSKSKSNIKNPIKKSKLNKKKRETKESSASSSEEEQDEDEDGEDLVEIIAEEGDNVHTPVEGGKGRADRSTG